MKRILIISLVIMMLLPTLAFAALNREFSATQVSTSGTFSVKYVSSGVNAPFFYSIVDDINGGCTLLDGKTHIATVLTSPQMETGTITIKTPSSDTTCYFNGNSQFAADNIINFPQGSVKVGQGGNGSGSSGGGSSGSFGSIGLIAGIAIVGFILYKIFNK